MAKLSIILVKQKNSFASREFDNYQMEVKAFSWVCVIIIVVSFGTIAPGAK